MIHNRITSISFLIILILNANLLCMKKEETFAGIVVLDVMFNQDYIKQVQTALIKEINKKFGFEPIVGKSPKPNVWFAREKMPHVTLVEIHDLPLNKKNILMDALENAAAKYRIMGYGNIHGILVKPTISLLGQDENMNKFPVISIDDYSLNAQAAYNMMEKLKNLIIDSLKEKNLDAYYKTYTPWKPHISLGKANKSLPADLFSGIFINQNKLGAPLQAWSFRLFGQGSRRQGYPTEKIYYLESLEKKTFDLVTVLDQIYSSLMTLN